MPRKKCFIYADESCVNNTRYMTLGGIIVEDTDITNVYNTLDQYRQEEEMHAELKWTKVTNQKYNQYKKFVDHFVSLNSNNILHFHSVIIDSYKVNHKKFSFGDKELSFFRFYYQLLLHGFGRRYGDMYDFYVYLDQKNTNQSLDNFRTILNNGMNARYGNNHRPFKVVEFIDSNKNDILQLNDVIIGAISYMKNKGHLIAGTRQSKIDLSNHIINTMNLSEDIDCTPRGNKPFTVWNMKLR